MKSDETKSPIDEKALVDLARQHFDNSVDELDAEILAGLRAARRNAVDRASNSQPLFRGWMIPAGGLVATAATIALTVSVWIANPPQGEMAPGLDDMSLLSATEDLEFIEELEFYQWLEEDANNVG